MTVAEITAEHYGWIIAVEDDHLGYVHEREIYLINHRSWEYQKQQKVGLTSKEFERNFRGTEYQYTAATPCRIVRQWEKPRRKAKAG